MLVTHTERDPKLATAGRQVALELMYETPVLVSAQAAGLIEVVSHEKVYKTSPCMTAKSIMDVYRGSPFYNDIETFGSDDFTLHKHQKVGEAANVPQH